MHLKYYFKTLAHLYSTSKRISRYYISSTLSKFSNRAARPTILFLGITNKCNMTCEFCFQHDQKESGFNNRDQGHMSDETFNNLLHQTKGWITHTSINLFGEPTIHPKLNSWLVKLKENGINVNLITNGKKISHELIETICNNQIDQISFSLETYSYNYKRYGGDFNIVVEAIKKIINKRGKRKKPLITVQSVKPANFSPQQVQKHEEYLSNLGVDYITWNQLRNWTGNVNTETNLSEGAIVNSCSYPWVSLAVDWDGSVTTCCEDFSLKNNLGNINNSSLKEIWTGDRIKEIRNLLRSKDSDKLKEKTACANCTVLIEKVGLNTSLNTKQNIKSVLYEITSNLDK